MGSMTMVPMWKKDKEFGEGRDCLEVMEEGIKREVRRRIGKVGGRRRNGKLRKRWRRFRRSLSQIRLRKIGARPNRTGWRKSWWHRECDLFGCDPFCPGKALRDDPRVFIYGQDVGGFGVLLRPPRIWPKSSLGGWWIPQFLKMRW